MTFRPTGNRCRACGGLLYETLRSINYVGLSPLIWVYETCIHCHRDTCVEIGTPTRGREVVTVRAGSYL